jgi:ribosome-associated protein
MSRRHFAADELAPWIEVRYDRTQGPGGQNVNKVSTRATLLFDFEACDLLSETQKDRLRRVLATRRARDGRLRIVAQAARTQARNRSAAVERLIELLAAALYVPRSRKPTRPTAGSRERRLEGKRRRGQMKNLRQRPTGADAG